MVLFTLLLSTSLCLNQAPPPAFVGIISAQRDIRTFAVHKSASLRSEQGPASPVFAQSDSYNQVLTNDCPAQ